MATLQQRSGSYRILFRHDGKREAFTLGKVPEAVATSKASRVDEILALLRNGHIQKLDGVSISKFIKNDGQYQKSLKTATIHASGRRHVCFSFSN